MLFQQLVVNYGNVLYNDALNTFYLRLYGVRHMVKDHSGPHELLFPISSNGYFILYAPSHRQDSTFYGLCYTSRGALAGTRLYGVRYMVKGHSDSESGNQLPPHGLLFPISSKGSFICTIPHTG